MIIQKKIIDDFVLPYSSEAKKYLQTAAEKYPLIYGTFSIDHSCYLSEDYSSDHLTFTDFTICCNELGYVGLANALKMKKIPEFRDLSYDYAKENQGNFQICGIKELFFHANVSPKQFSGVLLFEKIKKLKSVYFIDASVNFENKVWGNLLFNVKF